MKLKMLVLSAAVAAGSVNAEVVRNRKGEVRLERLEMGVDTEQHGSAPLKFDNKMGEAAEQIRDARRHDQHAYSAMKRHIETGKSQKDTLKKNKKSLARYNEFEKTLRQAQYSKFKDERSIGVRGGRDDERFSGKEYLHAVTKEGHSPRRR